MSKYDDIKIPENLKTVRKLAIEKADRDKNHSKSKKKFITAASICAVVLGATSIGVLNPALADSIPIVHNIFKDLNNKFNLGYIDSNDIQAIGETREYNGVSLSVDEAISDGYSIYLTYIIKSDEKLPRNNDYKPYGENSGDFSFYGDSKINNKNINISSSHNSGGYFKDDYTFVGVQVYDLDQQNKDIPEYIDFDVDIDGIAHPDKDIVMKGKWKFKFHINTNNSIKNIKVSATHENYSLSNIGVSSQNILVDFKVDSANSDFENLNEIFDIYLDNVETVAEYYYKISEDSNVSNYRAVIRLNNSPNKELYKKLSIKFKNNNEVDVPLDK